VAERDKDTYIVRNGRTGALTLPNGQRVHSLDRDLFDRAVTAAEKYISTKKPDQKHTWPSPSAKKRQS
jgi:hypothetical protein